MIRGDGTEKVLKAELHEKKQRLLAHENWKTLVAYSAALKTGVVYNYPKAYAGSNHVYARTKKDKKWRAMLVKREGWKVGDVPELKLKVTPFAAEAGEWKDKGRGIARSDKFGG